MKKGWRICALMIFLLLGSAEAEIIPSQGISKGFYEFTGIEAWPGVVLCESLTVRSAPSYEAKVLDELGNGDRFVTDEELGCYLHVMYMDGSREGWVRKEYTAVDPAWYKTEESTPAYAWGGEGAPRVALLDAGEQLPLLWENETHYVVALRGASAWIEKERTYEFSPARADKIVSAVLQSGERYAQIKEDTISRLTEIFAEMRYRGVHMTGCPFDEKENITVTMENGQKHVFFIALDSCSILREEHGDYQYSGDLRELFE